MSDEAKTIAEIAARHESVCRQDHASAELFDLAQYGREAHDHRATLLAIVNRQQEREAALREALRRMQVAASAALEIIKDETSPVCEFMCAIHRHSASALLANDKAPDGKALAGDPANG